jgi:membrane-associated phospholipid phosphatase
MGAQLRAPATRRAGQAAIPPPRPEIKHPVRIAVRLVIGAAVIFGFISLLGFLYTRYLNTGPYHRADLGVVVWLEHHRTAVWDHITLVGTELGKTETAIIVTAVLAVLLRLLCRRWYESMVMVIMMLGEVVIYLSVTKVIHQQRPPVIRLDVAPPTSSYPSGHTAASVALYGGFAIILLWFYAGRPLVRVIAGVLWFIPVFVGFSRLYRGMHYPTDVAAGALLSALWLTLVVKTFLPRRQPRPATADPPAPST